MSSVDAGDVHTASNEVPYQQVVIGSFSRESDHDAGNPPWGPRPKKGIGVAVEGATTVLEAQRGRSEVGPAPIERSSDTLDGGEHVSFAPPQRRKATLFQFTLELANVLISKREVVDEVNRILSVVNMHAGDVSGVGALSVLHEGFELNQLGSDRGPAEVAS